MVLALAMTLGMHAQSVEYSQGDSALVVKLLDMAKHQRGTESPIFYFGKKFLGLPYVGQTLELGDKEHLIVNLHGLDCTTFVETVVALAMCDQQDKRTFDDFCRNLSTIRFREGKMTDYTSRLHYFTWWAEDNERLGIVKDIAPSLPIAGSMNEASQKSSDLGAFTAIQTISINYMSAHPTLYKQLKNHPQFVPIIKKYEQATNGRKFRYIPKKNMQWKQDSALGVIKDGDIVAMLTLENLP